MLREAGQTVPPELLKFGTHVKKKESKLYGAHFKDLDPTASKSLVVARQSLASCKRLARGETHHVRLIILLL